MSDRVGRLVVAAGGWLCAAVCAAAPDFRNERVSSDVRLTADWVLGAADAQGRPFAIVDKHDARLYVFEPGGRLVGASAVLLGSAAGDDSPPDIAARVARGLEAADRMTPAGRFPSEPGHNDKGEAIVWIDYQASLAIHRLRPAPVREHRPARLATANPGDNRISSGCVVVPVDFYESVVAPFLGHRRGVVYVLPENEPARAWLARTASRPD